MGGTVTNLSVVSSDDVIASYQRQLSDAHHTIAVLEAKLAKALKHISGQGQGTDTGATSTGEE
jgi:hypothetical protein